MQDSTTMQQPAVTPQASIPSSAPAPSVAYQQAPAPSAPASYPTAPAAYSAPQAPAVNPWQEAYNSLAASLSGTQTSQSQAPSWVATQPAAPIQAASPVASAPYPAISSSAQPTWQSQQMPASYPVATPAPISSANATAPASDGYLQSVSSESLEVLSHFGAEAPALLNRYACVVEDALLNQAQQTANTLQQLQQTQEQLANAQAVIKAAAQDNAAYHTMLTNPDVLAQYVGDFFGPNGPYPTELPQDRLAAEVAANEQRYQPMPTFQRPQMEMPAPDVQASGNSDFWNTFSAISDRNPADAWKILMNARPEDLRAKVLVSEG